MISSDERCTGDGDLGENWPKLRALLMVFDPIPQVAGEE
jgi:hypothetical protein